MLSHKTWVQFSVSILVVHGYLDLQFQEINVLFWPPWAQPYTWYTITQKHSFLNSGLKGLLRQCISKEEFSHKVCGSVRKPDNSERKTGFQFQLPMYLMLSLFQPSSRIPKNLLKSLDRLIIEANLKNWQNFEPFLLKKFPFYHS